MGKNIKEIDLDVIGKFPRRFDKAIDAFREKMPNAIVASTVPEMVDKILLKLHSEIESQKFVIRRLSIFGHGNGNYVALSRFEEATKHIDTINDFSQSIYKRALAAEIYGAGSEEKFGLGNNDNELKRLSGYFSPNGYVKIESCYIAPGFSGLESKVNHTPYGLYLMKALAKLWQVPVMGGSDKQNPTPGLEGEVFTVYPSGNVKRSPFDPGAPILEEIEVDTDADDIPDQTQPDVYQFDEGLLPSKSQGFSIHPCGEVQVDTDGDGVPDQTQPDVYQFDEGLLPSKSQGFSIHPRGEVQVDTDGDGVPDQTQPDVFQSDEGPQDDPGPNVPPPGWGGIP